MGGVPAPLAVRVTGAIASLRAMAPSAVTTVLKSHFRLARNCLKGTVGDAINLILATAAYNCEKWMRASAPMLLFIGGAIISIGYMTPPLSVYGTRYANHCAPPQTALLAGDSSCRSVPHIMRPLHNMGRTKISGYGNSEALRCFLWNFAQGVGRRARVGRSKARRRSPNFFDRSGQQDGCVIQVYYIQFLPSTRLREELTRLTANSIIDVEKPYSIPRNAASVTFTKVY